METIVASFPIDIDSGSIKTIIEESLTKFTKYECEVEYKGVEDNEKIFHIHCNHGAHAFYLIGMAASNIMWAYDKMKENTVNRN